MKKEGKSFSCVGLRPSKIGDIITSLPILNLLEQQYPNSYKTISIAKKCAQCVPLLLNQRYIDRIHINEILERPNKEDIDFYNSHDLIIPPNLQHPDPFWYNKYSMIQENFIMMGLNWEELESELRIPKLVKWFDTPKYDKTIAIWPMAGNGMDTRRSPTKEWYEKLIKIITDGLGCRVLIFGHPNDFNISEGNYRYNSVSNLNKLDFFEQIKMTLGCSCVINTDAGSGLIFGAYEFPQITLLTDWMENHISNFEALAPMNKNNISIFEKGGCDNISHNSVINTIKQLS
jgi:ADP-heptose:LPS heptosyltransferase